MQVGFYSCCICKYDFIVYMVHGIISRDVSFNYCVREYVFCSVWCVI